MSTSSIYRGPVVLGGGYRPPLPSTGKIAAGDGGKITLGGGYRLPVAR